MKAFILILQISISPSAFLRFFVMNIFSFLIIYFIAIFSRNVLQNKAFLMKFSQNYRNCAFRPLANSESASNLGIGTSNANNSINNSSINMGNSSLSRPSLAPVPSPVARPPPLFLPPHLASLASSQFSQHSLFPGLKGKSVYIP